MSPRVWLIGENNPYQSNAEDGQRYAMYPDPEGCAGWRLCHRILGMRVRDYMRSFERRNLLHQPRWSVPAARVVAEVLADQMDPGDCVVLLGKRVHDAWFDDPGAWDPFRVIHEGAESCPASTVILPHPSGLSRGWNRLGAVQLARACVAEGAPHLAPLLGST